MNTETSQVLTPGLVLVVDDVEDNRILARAYLERIGWQVDECGGGTEAMAYLKRKTPQAMLIDMRMPDISGEQLAVFVRSQPSMSKVRLVGYTASSFADEIARFRAAGFDEVLIKPVLLASMTRALPDPRPAR